jgi:hypothetical protein
MGILILVLIALASFGLGLGMLLRPDSWLEFFRTARTETGRKVNRYLITRSTLRFQAAALLLGGFVFAVIAVVAVLQ